jgi:integrase
MSVYKTKSGSWSVRYRDEQGKQHQRTFELKRDAETYEREQRRAIERGTWQDPSLEKTKLSVVYEDFLKTKQALKPKSILSIESLWRHHIEPFFGEQTIRSITMAQVTKWVTDSAVGESARTSNVRITKAQVQLSSILDFAVDHGLLAKNPIRKSNGKVNKIALPKTDKSRPTVALTPEELSRFANACGDYETLMLLAGLSGLRWAELIGLQVQDFATDGKYVQVTRSLSEVNGTFHEGSTKSGQTRVVYLPGLLHSRIAVLLVGKAETDLVFTNSVGNPISLANFTKRVFKPAIELASIPRITPHDLRHTAASNAISAGANVLIVANMLGHSDPSITLKRYAHLFNRDQEVLAASIDKQFMSLQNLEPTHLNVE